MLRGSASLVVIEGRLWKTTAGKIQSQCPRWVCSSWVARILRWTLCAFRDHLWLEHTINWQQVARTPNQQSTLRHLWKLAALRDLEFNARIVEAGCLVGCFSLSYRSPNSWFHDNIEVLHYETSKSIIFHECIPGETCKKQAPLILRDVHHGTCKAV